MIQLFIIYSVFTVTGVEEGEVKSERKLGRQVNQRSREVSNAKEEGNSGKSSHASQYEQGKFASETAVIIKERTRMRKCCCFV